MASVLERKLIVITGKGGTGKTTVASALGLLGARRGLRTIVAEVGDEHRLVRLFGLKDDHEPGTETALAENLWSMSIDPDEALVEWLRTLGGRVSARLVAASNTFQYFAAAAPGAKELLSMVKVRELCVRDSKGSPDAYDLVVLDAPATGHALAMLHSPQTFSTIVRVGPLADQAQKVRELLEDRQRSAYLAVTSGTDMAVTETLELEEGLRRQLDRDLDAVVVNGTLPRRFTKQELERISAAAEENSALQGSSTAASENTRLVSPTASENSQLVTTAARTARMAHERARIQQSQIARLRRQRFADGMAPKLITNPFVFAPELDLAEVQAIATRLDRKL